MMRLPLIQIMPTNSIKPLLLATSLLLASATGFAQDKSADQQTINSPARRLELQWP